MTLQNLWSRSQYFGCHRWPRLWRRFPSRDVWTPTLVHCNHHRICWNYRSMREILCASCRRTSFFLGYLGRCHRYVNSLHSFSTALTQLSNSGSTLLAIGTSTTELFTALIGLFRSEREDSGPGTIVGAACFNTTLMIAASALVVQKPFWGYFTSSDTAPTSSTLRLRVWPLLRNSFFYAVAMIMLLIFYTVITPNQIDL